MQITRAADYALRGMTYLARQEPGKLSRVKEISNKEGIPEKQKKVTIKVKKI